MASRRICTPSRGFSLIEVLVALGIFASLALVLAVGPDLYRGYSSRDARTTLVMTLMHARAQAMDGVCLAAACMSAQAHGVHVDAQDGVIKDLILFEGSSYDPNDLFGTNVDSSLISQRILYTGPADISFAALSGDAAPATLVLEDGAATSTITISSEGQITWR